LRIRTALFAAAIALLLTGLAGYALAKSALPKCVQDTNAEIRLNKVQGFEMGGRVVPAERIEVTAEVQWPFVVVVTYSVPRGMHSSSYANRYIVLPGKTTRQSLGGVHLL